MVKLKPVIRGNTVYEVNPYTGKMKHITHGVDSYFRRKEAEENADEAEELAYHDEMMDEDDEEVAVPSNIRRMQLLKLVGNKKKLVAKSDGLKKRIDVDESGEKRKVLDRYKDIIDRKKKSKRSKAKRKTRKVCRCKK